jgi:hypothetical protein
MLALLSDLLSSLFFKFVKTGRRPAPALFGTAGHPLRTIMDGTAALSELQRVVCERARLLELSCGTRVNVEGNCVSGYGGFTWEDGNVYEGNWENGKQHGEGVFMWSQTQAMYSGQWQNGLQHGQGFLLLPDGDFNAQHYQLLGLSAEATHGTIKKRLEEMLRMHNPKQQATLTESELKANPTDDERRQLKRAKDAETQKMVSWLVVC